MELLSSSSMDNTWHVASGVSFFGGVSWHRQHIFLSIPSQLLISRIPLALEIGGLIVFRDLTSALFSLGISKV